MNLKTPAIEKLIQQVNLSAEKGLKTGTIICAAKTKDSIILGTDVQATLGSSFKIKLGCAKVKKITKNLVMLISGAVSPTALLSRLIKANIALETRIDQKISLNVLKSILGNETARFQGSIQPIFCLVTKNKNYIFSSFGDGGINVHKNYAALGSGMTNAIPLLDECFGYKKNLNDQKVTNTVKKAVNAAITRDPYCGFESKIFKFNCDGYKTIFKKD